MLHGVSEVAPLCWCVLCAPAPPGCCWCCIHAIWWLQHGVMAQLHLLLLLFSVDCSVHGKRKALRDGMVLFWNVKEGFEGLEL